MIRITVRNSLTLDPPQGGQQTLGAGEYELRATGGDYYSVHEVDDHGNVSDEHIANVGLDRIEGGNIFLS